MLKKLKNLIFRWPKINYAALLPDFKYISKRRAVTIVLVCTTIMVTFNLLPASHQLEDYISHKLEFWMRHNLGKDPELSSRIKIFAYDDKTVSYLKTRDISLSEWALVFESLAERRPKLILVDKLFDDPIGKDGAADFIKRVKALNVPVVVGTFISPTNITGRPTIPLNREAFDLEARIRGNEGIKDNDKSLEQVNWMSITNGNYYGPYDKILDAFELGHIVYRGTGYLAPFLRVSKKKAVPHWSMYVPDRVFIKKGKLQADDSVIPLDSRGLIPINIANARTYLEKTFRMKALIVRARKGKPISIVKKDDIVIILPGMYTGSTDWVSSPLGQIQGGYVMTAVVNSLLTNKWLKPVQGAVVFSVVGCALGGYLGISLWGVLFYVTFALIALFTVVVGVCGFIFFGYMVPWLIPISGFTLTAVTLLSERARAAKLDQVRIAAELETAKLVQNTFFPKKLLDKRDLVMTSFNTPASECGGDWWGHFSIGQNLEYIIIADAMGHGTSAALVTAMAHSSCMTIAAYIKEAGNEGVRPGEILERFNDVLYATVNASISMSCFVALIDRKNKVLRYANAGHNFPLLIPPSAEDERVKKRRFTKKKKADKYPIIALRASGSTLGMFKDEEFKDNELKLHDGDKIIFYTDGLIECRNSKGEEWGKKKFTDMIMSNAKRGVVELKDGIVRAAFKHFGKRPIEDDITLVIVEFDSAALGQGKLDQAS